jgi:predicted TIM-barrel fold metal-dependent hydrolase
MSNGIYAGPIIDAHHHLWDLELGRYPWLTNGLPALGDISYMRHTYLPADYLRDVGETNLAGSVHIEAVWDRTRNPVEETEWLDGLDKPRGVATRCIAFADLAGLGMEARLEAQAAHPRVAGVRETIRWHPDPAKAWTQRGLVDSTAFRTGAARLGQHQMVLELLMNAWQAEEVTRLAQDLPDQPILVNHCGTPNDRDAEGLARWHAGLARMAACPNIAIKVSNFGAYDPDRSLPSLRRTVMGCIDAFGPQRAMFGTDYPVARRNMTYAAMVAAFAEIIRGFSADEQRAMFHDNAWRAYGFGK